MTKDISRRGFLGAAGGAAAAGALGPLSGTAAAHGSHGHGKGGDIPLDRIGIQLFTVRDLLADNELDLAGTFEVLRDAGYAEVEVGGTYDSTNNVNNTAAQFRAVAERYDLKPEGMHNPGGHAAWRANPEAVLDDAKALGLRYVGVASPAGGTPQTHAAYAGLAEEFNAFGAAARRRGLKFYFHNHPTDFALDGGKPIYDTLLAESDPQLVYFEMDIAWFVAGGADPVAYLRKHGSSRFPLFHVKDLTFTAPRAAAAERDARPAPAADHAGERQPAEPPVLAARRRQGRHRLRARSSRRCATRATTTTSSSTTTRPTTRRPRRPPPVAPLSPRPRNPAGSANTAWTSRKYLAELDIPKRRW